MEEGEEEQAVMESSAEGMFKNERKKLGKCSFSFFSRLEHCRHPEPRRVQVEGTETSSSFRERLKNEKKKKDGKKEISKGINGVF